MKLVPHAAIATALAGILVQLLMFVAAQRLLIASAAMHPRPAMAAAPVASLPPKDQARHPRTANGVVTYWEWEERP